MQIQDFISIWQAQPFRAFRIVTQHGEFSVNYPMGAALTPQMNVAVIVGDERVEIVSLDEIVRCESFGQPMSVAETIGAIHPETLARNAQLMSMALASPELPPVKQRLRQPDKGTTILHAENAPNGVHVVYATVKTREGKDILSTAGTRWSLHGVEQFENGTSLYLHHLDHPADEQRIILWPPDRGTFDSFAEAMTTTALAGELHRRDAALAAKPAKTPEPPADYFRKIVVKWEVAELDGWEEAFGAEPASLDPARFEFVLVPRKVKGRGKIQNPCLTDMMKEDILFNLVDTDWDASGRQEQRNWDISLRHASCPGEETTLHVDVDRRAATIDDGETLLPLGWIERHLRNFELYKLWEPMIEALRAGPPGRKQPDVLIPLADGFRAELWAGDPRYSLPFLQPRITGPEGNTVFDLRATPWSAAIRSDNDRPLVLLSFSDGEQKGREAKPSSLLQLDLVSHRVTCPQLKGSTTIGMIQNMVRQVRGEKWMREEIRKWFAKGRMLEEV